jgi:hypothetical protein
MIVFLSIEKTASSLPSVHGTCFISFSWRRSACAAPGRSVRPLGQCDPARRNLAKAISGLRRRDIFISIFMTSAPCSISATAKQNGPVQ